MRCTIINGPEFIAKGLRRWLSNLGVGPLYTKPGSSWENGYIESFNGKFRDELLNLEVLDTLLEDRVLTARWRQEYNWEKPHSSLGYRSPAPEAFQSSDLATLNPKTEALVSLS